MIESQRPDGRIDRYDIDVTGQLIAYTDPAQRITRLRYDRSGRLLQRVDALGHSVEFGYDAYGRLQHLSNENHERYRFEWDALDRLLAQQDLDGSGRIYQYNPRATRRARSGRQGQRRTAYLAAMPFDEPGNLQTLTLPDQHQLNHLYYTRRLVAEILTHPGLSDYRLDRATIPPGKAGPPRRKKGAINDRPKYNERSFSKTTS
ncbi:hypothetical protein ACW9I4_06845 [Pseudomonas sp. SDT2931_S440]